MTEGKKFDSGKLRWSLLPWREVREVVKVLEFGAVKYSLDNWKKVEPKSRYVDAMFRHLTAWASGEKLDSETGLSHLAHLICCALFLLWADIESIDKSEGND
ncbi:MAG: dATP/dGTP diphosphohydrolase domain-containing protein [Candidatus Omnitrophota bacterium]|jgi:hypothetical protein